MRPDRLHASISEDGHIQGSEKEDLSNETQNSPSGDVGRGQGDEECFLGRWQVKDREIIVRCLKNTHDYQEQQKSDCLRTEASQRRDDDRVLLILAYLTLA